MSGRIDGPAAVALLGGALVMLGAWLPWLTLFAGLQPYGGMIGIHGQLLFAGGALAVIASLGTLRWHRRWIRWGTALLGLGLVGFTWWLLAGLAGVLRHDVSAMLVPRAGPGLFVSSSGAALIMISPGLLLARGSNRRWPHGRRSAGVKAGEGAGR
jgi:hypothetical protein